MKHKQSLTAKPRSRKCMFNKNKEKKWSWLNSIIKGKFNEELKANSVHIYVWCK